MDVELQTVDFANFTNSFLLHVYIYEFSDVHDCICIASTPTTTIAAVAEDQHLLWRILDGVTSAI